MQHRFHRLRLHWRPRVSRLQQLLMYAAATRKASGGSAPSVGVHVMATSDSSGTLTTGAVTTQASGSTILLFGLVEYSAMFTMAFSDSKGNTYTLLDAIVNDDGFTTNVAYCANAVGGRGHTFTLTDSHSFPAIFALEVKGADTVSPIDGHAVQQTSSGSGPYTSGNITTTNAKDLLVAFGGMDAESYPASVTANTLTLLDQTPTTDDNLGIACATEVESAIVTKQGSFSGTLTTAGTVHIIAIKGPSS